jgi:tetratricopeptide (TPR) repeat protein
MKIDIQEQIDKARNLFANEKATRKELNEAEDIFNGILNLDKKSPVLLFYLASLFMKKGYNALAIYIYKLSLEINDKLSCSWNNLGYVYRLERMMNEAQEAFKKACEINPNDSDYLLNYGSTFIASGQPDKVIEILDKALKIDANNTNALWNRSLAHLEKGDYENGWKEYDSGTRTSDREIRNYHNGGTPLWDGKKGQTVVVYGEQGIGDEIMFASMLPDIMKDCNVILDAHPRLYQIFRNSFPSIPIFGTRKDLQLHWPAQYKIDARISLGSLGKFYRNKESDFPGTPYLKADAVLIEQYKEKLEKLGNKPKIGVSWKGGTKQTNLKERTITLKKLIPLFKAIDADWISLQYTEEAKEHIDNFEKESGIKIHHWQDAIDDYDFTAALVSNLDLIISVPQSVVNLAGALGIPTFQLTPKQAMWQMGVYGKDMPWYRCVKNIWQTTDGDWDEVINKAKDELCALYQMSIAS